MKFEDMLKELSASFSDALNKKGDDDDKSVSGISKETGEKIIKGLEDFDTRMTAIEKLLTLADEKTDTKPGEIVAKMAEVIVDGETNREALIKTIDRLEVVEKAFGIRQSRGDDDEQDKKNDDGKTKLEKTKVGSGIFDGAVKRMRSGGQVRLT